MNATTKEVLGQKFTTSNFTESIVVASDSVFGSGGSSKPASNVPVVKKRKLDSNKANTTDDMIRYCKIVQLSKMIMTLVKKRIETSYVCAEHVCVCMREL